MSMTLSNPNEMRREMARRQSSKAQILSLLRAAGTTGQTNGELNHVTFRYGARILELRREGHDIESIHDGDGAWTFVLHEPARSSTPKPGTHGYLASLPVVVTPDTDDNPRPGHLF